MQKILIVDDEPMMLRIASKILSKKYQIVMAASGAEAIEIFMQEKPDMVLSDLIMPEMDGYELHNILQAKSSEPVPIMFMTADESDESESHGFEIGAADYIRKPLKAEILMRRVGNILDNLDKMNGLKHAADVDTMTGLLNKTASQRKISELCATAQGVLLMIDLDSFKLVNDIHGHAAGDRILIKFSELLNNIVSAGDLLGRMGGDEFIAFCQNINDEKIIAEKTAYLNEKIVDAAKKYMGANFNIPLGVSIGAVKIPAAGRDFADLYKKADKALYNVKQNGKHGCAFYSENNDTPAQEDFSALHAILGERNVKNEAYFVGAENFKLIYRMAVRFVKGLNKEIQFVRVTIEPEKDSDAEELKDLLIANLRVSDCIAQVNKRQFLILLMETKMQEWNFLKLRLTAKVKVSGNLSRCKIEFEEMSL